MYLKVYSKLVTSSSQKFIEAYSKDKRQRYDVAPVYRIETPNEADIGKSIRNDVKSIINEELGQNGQMIHELLDLDHEDIHSTQPIGKDRTEPVQVGEVHVENDGMIANIEVNRVFNTLDTSGVR